MTSATARWAPVLVAAVLAAAYVIVSPPSADLAAQLFRARLFSIEGFALWDDQWYAGHGLIGYSVLYPAVAALLTPQLAAGLAATASAAVFEPFARRHFGAGAWLGAILFGAGTAIDLYTGRLAFAVGVLPALGAVAALDTGALPAACALALLAALCSPVAALFTGVAGIGYAAGGAWSASSASASASAAAAAAAPASAPASGRAASGSGSADRPAGMRPALGGAAVAAAALVPTGLIALAFPDTGSEPFDPATLLPVLVLVAALLLVAPRRAYALRATAAVYGLAVVAVYVSASPIGGNVARLGTLLAAPLGALLLARTGRAAALLLLLPLLYVGWQAPVLDVVSAATDPSADTAYYAPLLRFLTRVADRGGAPFRIEIPLTRSHWEADAVAGRFAIARGWERQTDIADNPLFYDGRLTAATYRAWLTADGIRFVAAPDAPLDYSARGEMALIRGGLPYLRLVWRSVHWRVYAVADATPIVTGAATLRVMGPDTLALTARRPGTALVRVRFTPYWALTRGAGCVAPAGPYTRLTLRRAGPVVLATRFALDRIDARSPRCTPSP